MVSFSVLPRIFHQQVNVTTMKYDDIKQFCFDQGAQLCAHSDICPQGTPVITGVLSGDNWVAIGYKLN